MAAITGSNYTSKPRWERGYAFKASGYATHATVATGDVITWTNILPEDGVTIKAFKIYSDKEVDTNASPGTFKVGNSDDDDGFLAARSMGTAGDGITAAGVGALVGTYITNRSVVATLGTVGTAASNVTWFIEIDYECGNTA